MNCEMVFEKLSGPVFPICTGFLSIRQLYKKEETSKQLHLHSDGKKYPSKTNKENNNKTKSNRNKNHHYYSCYPPP